MFYAKIMVAFLCHRGVIMNKSESAKPAIQDFGKHNLIVYNSINKLEDIIGIYFNENLKSGMKLFYVYNEFPSKAIINGLSKYNIDLDYLIDSGEMKQIDLNQVYSANGSFDADEVISGLENEVKTALNEGFKGLCVVEEMSRFLDNNINISQLLKYEALLNPLVMKSPLAVTCLYDYTKMNVSLLTNLKKLHPVNRVESIPENNKTQMDDQQMKRYNTDLLMMDFKELSKVDFLHRVADMISDVLRFRNIYIEDHNTNVSELSKEIGIKLKKTEEQVESLKIAGKIHDAGMLSQSVELLNKPGPLMKLERQLIFDHPRVAYELAKKACLPESSARAVLEHHEKIDGSGYPNGLTGERMSIEGKILAVAEVVAAMSFYRPYRQDYGVRFALKEIEVNSGRLYDTEVVKACLQLFNEGFKFNVNGIG
jgi:HD-GYP domain-containing protein (c-di-GMP phosphodiesterase class II)